MSGKRYRIGELAPLTGLTPDALRFYERQGVLDKPARTSGRFRIYSPVAVDRVRFIKKAQALGFTLGEIRDLVQFNGKGSLRRCARVRDLFEHRLSDLEVTLSELGTLRETLRMTLRQCKAAIATRNETAKPHVQSSNSEQITERMV
jgi:MerR family Zn(II)-responsive transcriptional regulator of zntA